MTTLVISAAALLVSATLHGQFLLDPSFEGPGGENNPPPDWHVCENQVNHPDGGDHSQIDVHLPASEGETYLTMRVRDSNPPTPEDYFDTREFCYADLLQPLEQYQCYRMQVDLAYDDTVQYFSEITYVYPTVFRVYGTIDGCTGYELLGETEVVDHKFWRTYELLLTPQQASYNMLYIEPYYATDTTYVGILLVDNIRLSGDATTAPEVRLDTLVWPGEEIHLQASEGYLYDWDPVAGLSCYNCRDPLYSAYIPATIGVTISPRGTGCPDREIFNIGLLTCDLLYPDPTYVRLDTLITEETEFRLQASEGNRYEWMVDGSEELSDNQELTFPIEHSTLIECIVTDSNGCKFTEVFRFELPVTYPNVITPDGNDKNDVFRVEGLPDGTTIKIFARNGSLVFSSKNYKNDWNGVDLSKNPLPEDTYWFVLTNRTSGLDARGFVLLKR